MRKNKLFLSLLMVMLLSVGNVWADADVTYDFTGSGWSVSNDALTNGTVSFTGEGSANFKMSTGYFMLGKSGAYITFPAYSKAVEKIVVTGRSGASTSTKMNIFVGDATVSTETTGSTSANTYEIASASQVAGTIYTLKVTSNHNAQITKIEVFYVSEGSGDEPGGGDDPEPTGGDTYELVTNVSDLAVDDEIIIVNVDNSKALSTTQNSNNRGAAAVTITNDAIVPGDDVQIITLGQTNEHWTLYTGSGYLYASSSSSNQLKTQVTNNANGEWTISISNGEATLTAQGSNTRNVMQYNASNSLFACYASANQAVLAIFKKFEGSTPKQAAGLSFATPAYLVKANGALTTPTLTNPNSLSVSYASSDANVVAVNENTGALTIKSSGKAVITASSAETDTYKAGSASYTIYVAEQAGTAEDPLSETSTKALIDLGCTLTAHVNGVVASATYNSTYHNYTVYLTGGLQFYRLKDLNNADFTSDYLGAGDEVTAVGALKKYNSTYELDEGCYLTNYVEYTAPKTSIANDQANPYTVAQAITYAADGVTYDLDDYVYVQGVVYDVKNFSNGAMDIFIKDANAENQFELYKCAGINDGNATTPFDALTDVQVGDVVIGYGQLTVYNSVYELKQGNYLVDLDREEVVLTDYYEKVTETAGITDGTYLIVYEAGSLAFNGGLETLDDVSNTIEVAITNDNKIGVTTATEAATFFIDATAGTIQAANNKYIGVTSNSNGLKTSDEANAYSHNFSIDNDGNAIIAAAFEGSTMSLRYNTASNQARFRYYKDNGQQPIQLYKLANETVKANPELAWSAESVEITLGETFTAPTLDNPHSVAGITYASDNEALATVTSAGVISLVADATGTAHITATFAGNDDYKAVNVSCTIIVNSSTPTPAETKNVVILAEYNSKFYAMTTTLDNKAFKAVEVEKDGDKIVVFAEADKAAIQWTMTDNTTTATFQDAEDKYLAHTGTGTDLTLQADAENWTWDSENSCYYMVVNDKNRTFYYRGGDYNVFKNYTVGGLGADGYSGAPEIIEIAAEDIILSQKANPQLAYTPNSVTLTVGGTFTPAVLSYTEGFDGLAAVTYASNNEALATVNESGVVSLVAAATGTATITATFAGNNNYQAGSASYTITVSEAGDDLSGTWALVTDVEQLAAGKKVVIAYCGLEGNYLVAKTMGAQNTNNRAAVESSTKTATDYTSLTLGPGTKVFTLVDAGDGKFAIKASNGNYLTSATSGTSNNLLEAADYSLDNAKWTISISNEVASIVAAAGSKTVMQYNSGSTLFSCYGSASQKPIRIYMLQEDTPVVPEPDYTRSITAGQFGTICLPNSGRIEDATIFEIAHTKEGKIFFDEISEATMVAGRPYIFYPNNGASELKVYYTGSENAAAGSYKGLYGSYVQSQLTQNDGNYILYDNKYYLVDSEAYVGANRAYIKLGEVPTEEQAPAPGRRRVSMDVQGEQVATSIINTHYSDQPMKVMIDNQLYIIRAGQMFDMTGNKIK